MAWIKTRTWQTCSTDQCGQSPLLKAHRTHLSFHFKGFSITDLKALQCSTHQIYRFGPCYGHVNRSGDGGWVLRLHFTEICLKFNMGVSNSTVYQHLHDLIWKWVLRANIYVLSFSLSNIPRIHTNTYSIYHILIIMHAVNKTNLHWPSNNTKVMWIHLWKHDLYIFWRKQQD